MKHSNRRNNLAPVAVICGWAAICLGSLAGPPAHAANWYYWTSGGTASLGGSGFWTMPNGWFVAPSGPHANWSDGNDAIFAGTAGTVTLNSALTLGNSGDVTNALRFTSSGYVLSGGTLNLQGGAGSDASNPVLFVGGSLATNSVFTSPTTAPWPAESGWPPTTYGNIYKTGVGTLTLTGTDQFRNGGNVYLSDGFMDVGTNAVGITQQSTGLAHNVFFSGGFTSYGVLQLQGNSVGGGSNGQGYGNSFGWQGGNGGFAATSGTLNVNGGYPQFSTTAGFNRITFGSPTAAGNVFAKLGILKLDRNPSYATPANGGVADTLFVIGNPAAPNAYTELYGTIGDNGYAGASSNSNPAPSGGQILKNGSGTLRIGGYDIVKYPYFSGPNSYSGSTIIRAGTLMVATDAPSGTWGALGDNSTAVQLGDPAPLVSGGVTAVANYNVASLSGTTTITDGLTDVPLAGGSTVLLINQSNAAQNGVYTVNASGAWTPSGYVGGNLPYGLRTWVQSGDNYGGRYIYLASTGTLAAAQGVNAWRLDAEGASNLNVALLTSGTQMIGKDIVVVANSSTGTSTLGGAAFQTLSSTFTGNITLNKNLVLTSSTTGSNVITFSGNIQEQGSSMQVTKTGPGAVLLSGANNTYSGNTVVSQGLLSFASAGALPNSGYLIAQPGGYIGIGYPSPGSTFLNHFADGGGTASSSLGVIGFEAQPQTKIDLTYPVSFGDGVRISTRTAVTFDSSNTLTFPGRYRFGGGGGTLTVNSNLDNFGGQDLTSFLGVVEMGTQGSLPAGTTILGGTNTYTGGTQVLAGYLVFAASSAFPSSGSIILSSSGYVAPAYAVAGSTFLNRFTKSTAAGIIGFEGGVSGAISLASFNDAVRLGARTGTTVTISSSNTITPRNLVYRLGGGGGTLYVNSALTNSGAQARSVDVGTSGYLPAGTVVLAGANTFTGTATVSAGVLQMGSSGALGTGNASVDVQNGSTLDLTTYSPKVALLRLTSGTVTGSGGSITASLFDLRNGSVAGTAILAGTGTLTKSTTGTVTLTSPSSTYTGVTTLSGGSLVVTSMSDGGSPSTIGAAPANAENLVFNGGTLVYAGASSGTSNRLLTLTANGGAISVTSGGTNSLSLTGTGAIGLSGTGSRQLTLYGQNGGANLLAPSLGNVDAAHPTSLAVAGGSTWVLTGSNTYTGPTQVNTGTLQIGSGGTVGSLASSVALSNSAVLAFNRSGALTYSGAITGVGRVTNTGSGLLTLTGSSNYSLGTTLSTGTTSIVNGSALGTGLVTLSSSATLQLAGNSSYTVANAITLNDTTGYTLDVPNQAGVTLSGQFNGYGSVQKTGNGLLTVGGPMAISGGLTVAAGTLQVGAGGSIGGSVVNNANLVFNRADNSSFIGNVSGSGAFTKTGAGALSISSTQAMTGSIAVSQGTLRLTPAATPASMSLWLDATRGVLNASGSVYQWADQSGFKNNATQTSQGLAPTYGTNAVLNGAPVVNFDGVRTSLNVNLNFMTHSVPYTIFTIEGNTASSGAGYILGSAGPGMYDGSWPPFFNRVLYYGYVQAGLANLGQYDWQDLQAFSMPTGDQTFNVMAGGLSADGHFLSMGGTSTVTDANTAGIMSFYGNTTIGVAGPDHIEWDNARGKNLAQPLYYKGDMAEILIFNYAMDSSQVAAVSNYLSSKWLGATPHTANLLPTTATVMIDSAGTLDLSSADQTLAAVVNGPHGGGAITNSGNTDAVLTIVGTSDTSFTGVLQDGPTHKLGLANTGAFALTLGGVNTYTGTTSILQGTIVASQLANGGLPSSIGASSSGTENLFLDGGCFRYTGSGASTDRLFTIGNTSMSATIDASGTGPLVFSNTGAVALGPWTTTFTLAGNSKAANTFVPQLNDPIFGQTGLVKEGPGTWILTSPQPFTGSVAINGGRLALGPLGSLDKVPIVVAGGATFAVQPGGGTISTTSNSTAAPSGATLTLLAGATFDMTDGSIGQFNLVQDPGFNSVGLSLQGATLKFDLAAGRADLLTLNHGSVSALTGNTISITGVGTSLTTGSYPIINSPQGGLGGNFSLVETTVTVGATTYGITLANSTTAAEIITVTGALPVSGGTWTNGGGGYWGTAGNWSGNNLPTGGTVYFTNATSGTATVTVGAHRAATNLVFGQSGPGANYDLQVGDNGSMLLTGSGGTASIVVRGGNDSVEIPLTLAANLLVTPSAGSTLALAGNLDQSGGTRSLTLSGPGTLVLSGTNSYSGGTIVNTGTLLVSSPSAILSGSNLTVGSATLTGLFHDAVVPAAAVGSPVAPAVPEPSTAVLFAAFLAACGCSRRWWTSRRRYA